MKETFKHLHDSAIEYPFEILSSFTANMQHFEFS